MIGDLLTTWLDALSTLATLLLGVLAVLATAGLIYWVIWGRDP